MMYPFMTLKDETEIVHSQIIKDDGKLKVKVYIETPDKELGFRHATCWLPEYKWEDIYHFNDDEISNFQKIIESSEVLIMKTAKSGR